jgi:DNA end-binding protein Ku
MSDSAPEMEEGMSTTKKVAAGAAVGVAIPAAVTVAKKLLGDDEPDAESASSDSSSGKSSRSSGTSSRARSSSGRRASSSRSSKSNSGSRSAKSRSRSAKSGSSAAKSRAGTSSSSRTKEQLYATAKRLKIDGRSKMSKAQLERAVARAR